MRHLFGNYDIVRLPPAPPQVFIADELDPRLTLAARHLNSFIAENSAKKYLPLGVALFGAADLVAKRAGGGATAWSESRSAKHIWKDTLLALNCKLSWRSKLQCFIISPPPELENIIITGLAAASHLYDAARDAGVAHCNPLQIRTATRLRDAVSLFRPKLRTGSVRTTRKPADVAKVVTALRARCPPNVAMLFELMAEGLARVSEEARLTVFDWGRYGFQQKSPLPTKATASTARSGNLSASRSGHE